MIKTCADRYTELTCKKCGAVALYRDGSGGAWCQEHKDQAVASLARKVAHTDRRARQMQSDYDAQMKKRDNRKWNPTS